MSNSLDPLKVGTLVVTTLATLPANTIGNAQVAAGAAIDSGKVGQEPPLNYYQAPGSNIAAATVDLHICNTAGTFDSVEAALTGQIPSGDKSATVDIQKSTGGGAFATILTSVITLDSGNTIRVLEEGAITTTTFADGDLIRCVVALGAGATGTAPQGLIVTVVLKKAANP